MIFNRNTHHCRIESIQSWGSVENRSSGPSFSFNQYLYKNIFIYIKREWVSENYWAANSGNKEKGNRETHLVVKIIGKWSVWDGTEASVMSEEAITVKVALYQWSRYLESLHRFLSANQLLILYYFFHYYKFSCESFRVTQASHYPIRRRTATYLDVDFFFFFYKQKKNYKKKNIGLILDVDWTYILSFNK